MSPESPKSRFLKTVAAKAHAELVVKPEIQAALDVALLQMQFRGNAPDLGTASANWLKLEGAKEFIRIFLLLGDKAEPKQASTDRDNLQV